MPLNIERHFDDVITPGELVKFDKIIYDHYDESYGGGVGYTLMKDGVIHIHKPGDYVIKWMITQMTGFSINGQHFALKKRLTLPTTPITYEWVDLHESGDVLKMDMMTDTFSINDEPVEFEMWNLVDPPAVTWDGDTPLDGTGQPIAIPIFSTTIDTNGKITRDLPLEYYRVDANGKSIPITKPFEQMTDEFGNPMFDEQNEPIPKALLTVGLFNVSEFNIKLSPHNHLKAALMIFNIPPLEREGEMEAWYVNYLVDSMDAYEDWYTSSDLFVRLDSLTSMRDWQDAQLATLENKTNALRVAFDLYYSLEDYQKHVSLHFQGMYACYLKTGVTYNFWSSGRMSQPPVHTSERRKELVSASQCKPLEKYLGDPCVSPCYCITANGFDNFWTPIYFDNTGIYFLTDDHDLFDQVLTLKFTRALILS